MVARKEDGIADDARSYEDLPETGPVEGAPPRRRPPPRAASGIANDASLFEGLLEENTDAARSLKTQWLYQQHGRVFGPILAKELLEMLYRGDIDESTPIAVEDGDFQELRRIGVFRVHLPKVAAHLRELEEARAQERAEARARLKKRAGLFAGALLLVAAASAVVVSQVRSGREAAALAEKEAKEEALLRQIEDLLASVTIEPPLMPLVDEPAEHERGGEGRRARRKDGKAVARFTGGTGAQGAEELSGAEIMEGVARAFGGIKRCIVDQLRLEADSIPDQLVLTFVIDNDGTARDVSVTDRHLRRSPLMGCLQRQIAGVTWRRFKGEVRNVEYPINIGGRRRGE